MKNIIIKALIFILFISANSAFAQKLYYRHGSIPLTDKTITLLAGKHRGECQWQCSADAVEWINIEDQTNDTLKIDKSDAGYYRAEITDESCHVLYSDTALVSSGGSSNETGAFTDRRDGKVYKWVKIGTQVWMAENLAFLPAVSPSTVGSDTEPRYYVLDYNGTYSPSAKASENFSKFGVLYNWTAAQLACPSGWHLPSDNEWSTLANSLGGKANAGFNMKTIEDWNSSIMSASNLSGFTALPGGARFAAGSFPESGLLSAHFWTDSLSDNTTEAYAWSLFPTTSILNSYRANIQNGFSIRCVKDTVDVLELTVTVPQGVDPNTVSLEFPTLKYNKKLAVSWINDDGLSPWNWVYNLVNKKFVSTAGGNFHLGMPNSTGYIPKKFLEYTDGAGVKHRYASSVAVFSFLLEYMGRNTIYGSNIEWITPKELRIMQDFGSSTLYHNLKESATGSAVSDKSSYDHLLSLNSQAIMNMTDRVPKIMAEPDGNHQYMTWGISNSLIQMQTAQSDIVSLVKPFAPNTTLDKSKITVLRYFYDGGKFVTDRINQLKNELIGNEADRTWIICGNHTAEAGIEGAFFTQADSIFGASGNDALWFPSVDEYYEYWYMRNHTTFTKSVKGQQVKFKFTLPDVKNFYYNNFSVMLSGISDTTGITVESSDMCNGTSYAMNSGKLLVNLDYNKDLITKVEKYIEQFKNTMATSDLEDAQYFTQMLKPGVREIYQAQLKEYVSGPTLNKITINTAADTTTSRAVTVTASFKGTVTHYMISENPNFTGASWTPYVVSMPITLSSVAGNHLIYVKLKNNFDASSVASASIYYNKVPFALNSISLNNGDESTPATAVKVTINLSGDVPTHYKISEKPLLGDATWTAFKSSVIDFTMSSTFGKKTVYVKVKTDVEESKTKSDFITLTEPASLSAILLDSGAVSSEDLDVAVSFAFKGIPSHYMLSESPTFLGASWMSFANPVSFRISSEYNVKTLYAKVKDVVGTSAVCSATIQYVKVSPAGRKIIFCPIEENADQTYEKLVNGNTVNLCTTKQWEDWNNFILKDTDGQDWATRIAKPSQLPSTFTLAMSHLLPRDPNPTALGTSGLYPVKFMGKYFGIDGWPEIAPAKRGLRFQIEKGTYTLKVIFSTGDQETCDGQKDIVYEANGIKATPSGIPLNNSQTYIKLSNVIVGADGILDFSISQKNGVFAGFNVLEIIRAGSGTVVPTSSVPLDSISINAGAALTTSRTVSVKLSYRGNPTHYMISEDDEFTNATWKTMATPVSFDLSAGAGPKDVYVKIKDALEESNVAMASIEYKVVSQIGRKLVVSPVVEVYHQGYATVNNGTVINLCTTKQWEDWDSFSLKDVNGEPWATRISKPSQLPAEMKLQLEYNAYSNADSVKLIGKAVPYPITYMKKYFGIVDPLNLNPKKSGMRFLIEPGTYKVRILFSTSNKDTNGAQSNIVYEANKITASPSGILINNPDTFVELIDVVVGEDRVLDFYVSQKAVVVGGFNLLEIIKTK